MGGAASCGVCQEGPCKREGKRHLSRPRQGHTWAPQAAAPGQRLAPASLGRLPTHCGGRQLGWSPAQLCGRKPFVLGAWSGLVPPNKAGSLWPKDKLWNFGWLYLLYCVFLSSQSLGTEMCQVSALSPSYILQPFTLMFLPRKRGNCTPPPTAQCKIMPALCVLNECLRRSKTALRPDVALSWAKASR